MNKLDKMDTIAKTVEGRAVSKAQAEQYQALLKGVLRTIQNRMRHAHKLLDLSGCKIRIVTMEIHKEKCFHSEFEGKYKYTPLFGDDEMHTIQAFSLWKESDEVVKAVDDMLYVLRYMDIIKPLGDINVEIDIFNIEGDVITQLIDVKSISMT